LSFGLCPSSFVLRPSSFALLGAPHHARPGRRRCRGNIREAEKELGISYPTVCKRLDLVNDVLNNPRAAVDRGAILEQLERGEITAKEAAQLLR
jgi:hypothetical protein